MVVAINGKPKRTQSANFIYACLRAKYKWRGHQRPPPLILISPLHIKYTEDHFYPLPEKLPPVTSDNDLLW